MELPTDIVELALQQATQKAGSTYDRFGLTQLPSAINSKLSSAYRAIGERYVYDTIFLTIEKAKRNKDQYVRLDQSCLDSVAYYIGFKSIEEFRLSQSPNILEAMLPIEGNWYSCVRASSGRPHILLSPVQIRVSENKRATMELRGPHRTYQGPIKCIAGSISSLIVSDDGTKELHLVFKVGVARYPEVLVGLFSGVSSAGEPIAGKEVLFKSDELFDEMKNAKIPIQTVAGEPAPIIPRSIITYLADFEKSYFKVTDPSTFDVDDLYS